MSNSPIFGSLPEGRRLETDSTPEGYAGSVGPLRRADAASLRVARRNLREIPEKDIAGQGLHLVETPSGETWRVITSAVDLADPDASGAEAFVVRDGLLVPLRKPQWTDKRSESRLIGEIDGRMATGREPMSLSGHGVY